MFSVFSFSFTFSYSDVYLAILFTKPYDFEFTQSRNFLFISLKELISRHEVNLFQIIHDLAVL